MEASLQLIAPVYSVIMLILNDVFVKFTIMKLKYILTTLRFEYSTIRIYIYIYIYMIFILIKCVIASQILS